MLPRPRQIAEKMEREGGRPKSRKQHLGDDGVAQHTLPGHEEEKFHPTINHRSKLVTKETEGSTVDVHTRLYTRATESMAKRKEKIVRAAVCLFPTVCPVERPNLLAVRCGRWSLTVASSSRFFHVPLLAVLVGFGLAECHWHRCFPQCCLVANENHSTNIYRREPLARWCVFFCNPSLLNRCNTRVSS